MIDKTSQLTVCFYDIFVSEILNNNLKIILCPNFF